MQFEAALAEKAESFFTTYLKHVDGEWAGRPVRLAEWQRKIIRHVFGWVDETGARVTRKVYIEVPRKNGKSTMTAGLALRQLVADREMGAQVYVAAADKEQAGHVYHVAERMVRASPELSRILECVPSRKRILFRRQGSFLMVLSGEDFRAHGINASCIIFDELHVQRGRGLYEALSTSMGARRQPLFVMLTTAGFDQQTLCGEEHDYAQKVRTGIIEDPTYLPVIYAADPTDDPFDPATWKKANPSWDEMGLTLQRGIADQAQRAKDDPASLNSFLRLHLNIWTRQDIRWMPMDAWDASAGYAATEESLRGRRCVAGLDMAYSDDIAALVYLFFPEEPGAPFDVLTRFWIPEGSVSRRAKTAPFYLDWIRDGLLRTTSGDSIDYDTIREQILKDYMSFQIETIRVDPWNMGDLPSKLNGETGREDFVVRINQTFQGMSVPTKELMRLVVDRRVRHGGNKVLRWMADNVTVVQHADGRIRPVKERSKEKIDGIVAMILALDAVLRDQTAFMEGDGVLKVI